MKCETCGKPLVKTVIGFNSKAPEYYKCDCQAEDPCERCDGEGLDCRKCTQIKERRMKVTKYIVQLEENVWVAPWVGDPGRTVKIDNAQVFNSIRVAKNALKNAREHRAFQYAKIKELSR